MRAFEIAKGFEEANVVLPTRATEKSAGYDLRALGGYTLKPGETHFFKTGLKAKKKKDDVLFVNYDYYTITSQNGNNSYGINENEAETYFGAMIGSRYVPRINTDERL